MGLIYISSESSSFMSALKSNLSSSKETVRKLKSGSQKVVSAVDGHQLSGAAYTAGKELFSELIIPTITRTTNAIEQIEQELQKYQNADRIVANEGELNEDKLNQQLATTKAMKFSVDATASFVKLQARSNPIATVLNTLLNVQRNLDKMSDSFQQDIDHIQKQLRKLYDFNGQTSNLFNNSLTELKIAMQSVVVLNNTVVKDDGSYLLPDGIDKSWFNYLKDPKETKELDDKTLQIAMKEFNDLYSKNPAAALKKIEKDSKLYNYILKMIDSGKLPKKVENAVLGIFAAQKSWDKLPKDIAMKVLASPKFGLYMEKAPLQTQIMVYGSLTKLYDKGWDVLAPLGNVSSVLSKTSAGEKIIAGAKVGLDKFKKIDKVSEFLTKHKTSAKIFSVFGDTLTVCNLSYQEYIDPHSPAYGDVSKALYGGQSRYLIEAGPIEGEQYGGPVGFIFGAGNYFAQGGGLSDVYGVNKIPYVKDFVKWFDGLHTFITKEDTENWLKEQYDIYEKRHEGLKNGDYSGFKAPNSEYKPGIVSQSGSPNSNPNIKRTFPRKGN